MACQMSSTLQFESLFRSWRYKASETSPWRPTLGEVKHHRQPSTMANPPPGLEKSDVDRAKCAVHHQHRQQQQQQQRRSRSTSTASPPKKDRKLVVKRLNLSQESVLFVPEASPSEPSPSTTSSASSSSSSSTFSRKSTSSQEEDEDMYSPSPVSTDTQYSTSSTLSSQAPKHKRTISFSRFPTSLVPRRLRKPSPSPGNAQQDVTTSSGAIAISSKSAIVELDTLIASHFSNLPPPDPISIPDILITDWDMIHGERKKQQETTFFPGFQDLKNLCLPKSDAYTLPPFWSEQKSTVMTVVTKYGMVLARRKQDPKGCMWKSYTYLWKRRDSRARCACRGRALDLEGLLGNICEDSSEES